MRALASLRPILAVAVGLALGLVVVALCGESPWHVLKVLALSAAGSGYDLGMTLFYATPLIFTGLSVALAFQAGLFNIGAEGQLIFGALGAGILGTSLGESAGVLSPMLAGLIAFAAGAALGVVPGILKARFGSHEVIVTMMLNFVAAALASYLTLYHFKNPESQNPEMTAVGSAFKLVAFPGFGDAPLTWAFPLAVVIVCVLHGVLYRTAFGFEVRALGQSEGAARFAGVRTSRLVPIVMALAGGLAGLVALPEVLGNAGRFKLGFSPDYGFLGIAVALLGRGKPFGVLFSALLFGALHKGTADLDIETDRISRDLSQILQAFIILSVSADGLWDRLLRRRA